MSHHPNGGEEEWEGVWRGSSINETPPPSVPLQSPVTAGAWGSWLDAPPPWAKWSVAAASDLRAADPGKRTEVHAATAGVVEWIACIFSVQDMRTSESLQGSAGAESHAVADSFAFSTCWILKLFQRRSEPQISGKGKKGTAPIGMGCVCVAGEGEF